MRSNIIKSHILSIFYLCVYTAFGQSPLETKGWFSYEGEKGQFFTSFDKSSKLVSMSDGERLAVDVFVPKNGPSQEEFPAIFMFTPYNRAYFFPQMGVGKRLLAGLTGNGWDPIFDMAGFGPGKDLIKNGYVLVVADMRGTGASGGSQMPLMPQLGKDGKEIIEWITQQTWSNGKVGMTGPSYLGWAQFATAAYQPEGLKCIMPEVIGFDMFTGGNRPGGILATRWVSGFDLRLKGYNRGVYDFKKFLLPVMPVIDEDKDGSLIDERPVVLDEATLAGEKEPIYKDGSDRKEHYYLSALQSHLSNLRINAMMGKAFNYYDGRGPEEFGSISYMESSPGYMLDKVLESGIPIYHVGGWLDGFAPGTTRLYATSAPHVPSRLMIAPRIHFPSVPKAYRKRFDYKGKYMDHLIAEQLRFYDHYLKGIDTGMESEAPVRIFVMNEGWREEDAWPLEREKMTSFYFQNNGGLTKEKGEVAKDRYKVDTKHQSNYGKKERNRWLMYTRLNSLMLRNEADQYCKVYETTALSMDVEVTGHPIVDLWISSDHSAGDVFVYLSDVDEKGNVLYVSEGQLRSAWHEEHNDDSQVDGKLDVLPNLPWHGYKKSQFKANAMEDGQIINMRFDLMPAAWVFQKGHKIRISIAGVDAGNFQLNPELVPDGKGSNFPYMHYFIHRGGVKASRIELPVILRNGKNGSVSP